MPRSEKQKQKLFRILEILINETDEVHGLSMPEIISRLSNFGISAERKSIYDDIITLTELGFDIITLPSRPPKYTLKARPFEFAELKMLVDAVESSKFITREKSREIIAKLRLFAGKYRSSELSRQVFVEDRIKTANETTTDSIDKIHKAINDGKMISFKYFDYTAQKKRIYRHDGKIYTVSPVSLIWSDENYYLVAYDSESSANKNFRVDKMDKIEISKNGRDKSVSENRLNPAEYSRKIFGMYGGREELVTLECRERLAGVIIDRFGKDYTFFKTPFGFKVSIRVMVSPTFFAWVLGFGKDMRILSPESVRNEFLSKLEEIMSVYSEEQTE